MENITNIIDENGNEIEVIGAQEVQAAQEAQALAAKGPATLTQVPVRGKRVLLLCPPSSVAPFKLEGKYPLGLIYLAAVLEKEGHEVIVADYFSKDYSNSIEEMTNAINAVKPDVIGINCITMNRAACFEISKIAKELDQNITVIMGGVHASIMYEQILQNFPVDYIVIGEGEESTSLIVKNCGEDKRKVQKIKGIAYKDKKGKVIFTGLRPLIENLDTLPFPKHEIFRDEIEKTGWAYMITSRGCCSNCVFCSTTRHWGNRWRARSAQNVVDEMEHIIKTFKGVRGISFHDDTFILDNQRVIAICNEIMRRGIKIEWNCCGRIDLVTKEMLLKIKEAGCTSITYGIESGSQKMLDSMNKRITTEQIKRTVDITNEVGIPFAAFMMCGLPGETWSTIRESSEFCKTLKNLEIDSVGKLEVYPGTEVYRIAKEKGLLDDSWWLTDKRAPYYTCDHSEEGLNRMAAYIIIRHKMHQGFFKFLGFAIKFFFDKPGRALRYAWNYIK